MPLDYFRALLWEAFPSSPLVFFSVSPLVILLSFPQSCLYLNKHSFYSGLVAEKMMCLLVKEYAFS